MTIIEPHKAKYSFSPAMLAMFLSVIGLVCLNINFYNKIVDFKHSISDASKDLQALQVANAEAKSQLYKITDLGNLDSIARSRGLVKDKKPAYAVN